jgi:prepilin-type N-terminal cleavage/methylation domain-containing protein
MKISLQPAPSHRAFTLPEIMTVMALFALVLLSLISSQIMGMKMYRISESKLTATAGGRRALNRVRDEIRSGKMLLVGSGGSSTFTPIAEGTPHLGNAVQVYATTNTNSFVRYYLDPNEDRLKRVASGSTNVQVIANYVTNDFAFRAEDFQGNVLTNNQNNRVIRMVLEFYQWEFPVQTTGTNGRYDYYRLQTRITRRTIE